MLTEENVAKLLEKAEAEDKVYNFVDSAKNYELLAKYLVYNEYIENVEESFIERKIAKERKKATIIAIAKNYAFIFGMTTCLMCVFFMTIATFCCIIYGAVLFYEYNIFIAVIEFIACLYGFFFLIKQWIILKEKREKEFVEKLEKVREKEKAS